MNIPEDVIMVVENALRDIIAARTNPHGPCLSSESEARYLLEVAMPSISAVLLAEVVEEINKQLPEELSKLTKDATSDYTYNEGVYDGAEAVAEIVVNFHQNRHPNINGSESFSTKSPR